MRLETSLIAGRESLLTHGLALNTIGDDLANSNTPGYKTTRVEFGDILASGGNSLYSTKLETGSGVRAEDITVNHLQQGTLEGTSRGLDAAIVGGGGFILQKGDEKFYTRAGNFTTDQDGFIVSNTGANLLGYTLESPDTPTPLNARNLVGKATASTEVGVVGSLNPVSPLVGAIPPATTFAALTAGASYTNSVSVIDSLGQDRGISLYFYRTGTLTWDVAAYVDGASVGGVAGTPVQIGAGQIVTGPDGRQVDGAGTTLTLAPAWGDGAAPGNITMDLSKISAGDGGSSFSNITVNGFRGGIVKSVGFSPEGALTAVLESGEEAEFAQLALANFNSPDGLERLGENQFRETTESGEAYIGKVRTEGLGNVRGQNLESSTVDPAAAFIKMIQVQQGYRAGSQVIQAVNDLLTATIQIA